MVVGSKGDPRREAGGEHTHAPPSLPPRAGDGARPCPADPSSLCSSCASSASERAWAAVSWACVVARAPYRPWLSCSSSLMRDSDWTSLSRTWSKSSAGWVGQQICQQQTLSHVRYMRVARWLGGCGLKYITCSLRSRGRMMVGERWVDDTHRAALLPFRPGTVPGHLGRARLAGQPAGPQQATPAADLCL